MYALTESERIIAAKAHHMHSVAGGLGGNPPPLDIMLSHYGLSTDAVAYLLSLSEEDYLEVIARPPEYNKLTVLLEQPVRATQSLPITEPPPPTIPTETQEQLRLGVGELLGKLGFRATPEYLPVEYPDNRSPEEEANVRRARLSKGVKQLENDFFASKGLVKRNQRASTALYSGFMGEPYAPFYQQYREYSLQNGIVFDPKNHSWDALCLLLAEHWFNPPLCQAWEKPLDQTLFAEAMKKGRTIHATFTSVLADPNLNPSIKTSRRPIWGRG